MLNRIEATCLGYPRIGGGRELKKALEAFWAGKTPGDALEATAKELRQLNWSSMKEAGIDQIPSNDFSLYDHMLDTSVLVGAVPGRYAEIGEPLTRYFAMARGLQEPARKGGHPGAGDDEVVRHQLPLHRPGARARADLPPRRDEAARRARRGPRARDRDPSRDRRTGHVPSAVQARTRRPPSRDHAQRARSPDPGLRRAARGPRSAGRRLGPG